MKTINLGVLAHVDAGKTTTVERMLYAGNEIKNPGSVERGDTTTDWLSIERQRGISIRSASASFTHRDVRVNVVDTPGHTDFAAEVERALSILDAAVLILSAVEGVQPHAERIWRILEDLALPRLIFINKIDRAGQRLPDVLDEIRASLSPDVLLLSEARNPGEKECGAIRRPLSALTEDETFSICERDESLALHFLETGTIDGAALESALRARVAEASVFPVFLGAAALGVGVGDLLDAIVDYLPGARPVGGEPNGVVYKVERDPKMGKAAHIRLYAGTLRNRDQVSLARPGVPEPIPQKVTQIRTVSGERRNDTGLLSCGEIAAVYGLEEARAGDWVGNAAHLPLRVRNLPRLAVPLLAARILGDPQRLNDLHEATAELADEDPLLGYEWNADERELSIKIMGPIQLEILTHLFKERYGLDVAFSRPIVLYRETPTKPGIGFESYTMPKPCWAVVELAITPLPRGSGYRFESRVPHDQIFHKYQNHIALSVPETLRQGLLGWEVTDLEVILTGGEHHVQHTHNMDFFLATPIAVMDGLRNCGTTLLEPILRMRLTADESLAGRLIGDILAMRGEGGSPTIRNGNVHIEALVPLAASMDYPVTFASLTSGKGRIATDFHGYRECPAELGATTKRRGVDPLDRAKWILFKRGAV